MAENQGKWPSNRGLISKIRPSDGCRRDAVLLAVELWYDFPEIGGYLGNVGLLAGVSWNIGDLHCILARGLQAASSRRVASGRRWRWLIGARATTLLRKKHVNFLSRRNLGNSDVGHYLT